MRTVPVGNRARFPLIVIINERVGPLEVLLFPLEDLLTEVLVDVGGLQRELVERVSCGFVGAARQLVSSFVHREKVEIAFVTLVEEEPGGE